MVARTRLLIFCEWQQQRSLSTGNSRQSGSVKVGWDERNSLFCEVVTPTRKKLRSNSQLLVTLLSSQSVPVANLTIAMHADHPPAMKYDFSTLSADDFEDLSRDLVGADLAVRFEAFTAGTDGGIDGRHAAADGSIILQAKHYSRSGFSKLKSKMKEERQSIDRLKPKRYILATTVALTPANKDALAEIIGPTLQSKGDIFGADDLNAVLRAHPEIEKSHRKLWESSTPVLEGVLSGVIRDVFDSLIQSSSLLRFLHSFRFRFILAPAILVLMLSIGPCTPIRVACFLYDPNTDQPNKTLGSRECLASRPVYVKWTDSTEYAAVDRETGRWTNNVPNRSLIATKVEEDGTVVWGERDILREVRNKRYWQERPVGDWTEIDDNYKEPQTGEIGLLIRRQDPEQQCDGTRQRQLLETFLPTNLAVLMRDTSSSPAMKFRWVYFSCAEKRPLELTAENSQFNLVVGPIVAAKEDQQ